ncbi:carboxylesterase 1C [Drosophila tropicalis]|uniref:carboxylesterase 1C n=1 Tax=Drosophila tropicalis TaxID=46794 RepID=UPI0035AB9906
MMWRRLAFMIYGILFILDTRICHGQQTHIKLEQGDLIGLKVFPDGARSSVYAFLGVPYAQAPVGELRFAAAKPHPGWNRTLQAMQMQSVCPQLTNTIYDENADGSLARPIATDEDCLFLNIWTPETGLRYGKLPILVIISGEEFAYDWPRNRINGLDLAAEGNGILVVSVQYRNNIYGWLGLGSQHRHLPGNYGMTDVQLALEWLQANAISFGGNPDQITLLGHGSGGASLAVALSLQESGQSIHQLILMSPGPIMLNLGKEHEQRIEETGRLLVQKLGCQFEEAQRRQLLGCLRRKSQEDLLRAYESVYNHGNGSLQLGVVLSRGGLDEQLTKGNKTIALPPILIGITSNEGAFLQDYWLDVAREGAPALQDYINYTLMPNVLRSLDKDAFNFEDRSAQSELLAIQWRYFGREANVHQLLSGMQRLISEALYELPFHRLLDLVNGSSASVYAYVFDHKNSMDMRGRVNLFSGASHSSDLPLLLGPSLFQQIARRRFNSDEEQLCRKLRGAFANFVKSGNPTPGRIYDAWAPYTKRNPFIYSLGEQQQQQQQKVGGSQDDIAIEKLLRGDASLGTDRSLSRTNRHDTYRPNPNSYTAANQLDSGYAHHLERVSGFWQVLLPLERNQQLLGGSLGQRVRLMEAHADAARYRQGFYAMLGLVCLLLACLCLCVYLLRRQPDSLRRRTASQSECDCL